MSKNEPCPCLSGKIFSECCQPLILGQTTAKTPEELMRSRYSAFATQNMDYVFETTDPQIRSQADHQANVEWAKTALFTKLEILSSSQDGNKGSVEFIAHYEVNGEKSIHHEFSKFRKQSGLWFFRDGKVKPQPQT